MSLRLRVGTAFYDNGVNRTEGLSANEEVLARRRDVFRSIGCDRQHAELDRLS